MKQNVHLKEALLSQPSIPLLPSSSSTTKNKSCCYCREENDDELVLLEESGNKCSLSSPSPSKTLGQNGISTRENVSCRSSHRFHRSHNPSSFWFVLSLFTTIAALTLLVTKKVAIDPSNDVVLRNEEQNYDR